MCNYLVAAALLIPAGAASASQQSALELHALEREFDLGVVRLPVDRFSYELVPPDALVTPNVRIEHGVRWKYDGQARFSTRKERRGPKAALIGPDGPRPPRAERLRHTRAIDGFGRSWIAEDVDEGVIDQRIAAYDALVLQTFEPEPLDLFPQVSDEAFDLQPGPAMVVPATWYSSNCDSDSDLEIFRWGSDGRSLSSNPMSARQAKVLFIDTPGGTGSGTMIDDEWLLTAAHVVSNSGGTLYNPSTLDIYTYGNYQSGAKRFSADWVICPGSYSGDGDLTDDYALVRLTSKPDVGWMAISQASNSTIEAASNYNVGYPGYAPGCVSAAATPIVAGIAKKQYWSSGELFNATSNKIKTRIDLGTGHSGGPFYYYPSGCCGSHYLTGVVSAYVDPAIGDKYTGGPKGAAIRDWVITYSP